MTDDMNPKSTGPTTDAGTDEFSWTEPEQGADSGTKAREWLGQLQSMIENLATQAAPVVREIGVKAAELAAIAGDKAGPAAQKAAEFTGQAGQKLAEKSRDLAAEWRRDVETTKASTETGTDTSTGTSAGTDMSDSDTPTAAGVG